MNSVVFSSSYSDVTVFILFTRSRSYILWTPAMFGEVSLRFGESTALVRVFAIWLGALGWKPVFQGAFSEL